MFCFSTVTLSPGHVEYHTPYGGTPESVSNSNIIKPSGEYRSPTTCTGMDTSKEAIAAPHHKAGGPNESAAPTPPIPHAAAPRATITKLFPGICPLTGTGIAGTTPPNIVVSQTPTTGTVIGETPGALAATPSVPAKGPEVPSAAPEVPPTTTSTSGETMLPCEGHGWQGIGGKALFTASPKKKGKII